MGKILIQTYYYNPYKLELVCMYALAWVGVVIQTHLYTGAQSDHADEICREILISTS